MNTDIALIAALAVFVFGVYGWRFAQRYGTRVTLKPTPVDDARIHATVTQLRDWKAPAAKGFKSSKDDRVVDDLTTRRRLGERS